VYTLRRYNAPGDTASIHKLDHSIFKCGSSKQELEKMLGWVIDEGFSPVGYLLYTRVDDKNLFLETIGVDPTWRGQGIGTELMNKIISKADDQEQNIHLYINKQHQGLVKFYELFGFTIKNKTCSKAYTSIAMYRPRVLK